MSEGQNQTSLKFQIWNDTQNTTLKCYRCEGCQISPDLKPELPPGSSDGCHIFREPNTQGYKWILVYEAESFTLAFAAYLKWQDSTNVLHLELSLDKAHLGDFGDAFSRLIWQQNSPHADKTTVARCTFKNMVGLVDLSTGPYNVIALITDEGIEVKLQERGNLADLWESCRIL